MTKNLLYPEFIKKFYKKQKHKQPNFFHVQTPEETFHKRRYINGNKNMKSAQHH